jgi:ketosteroid isomerase-like protein
MIKTRLIFAFLVLIAVLASAATAADLKSLVEAERAFARLSLEKGIRTAFLANLAPDSVVFRPMPVPGRPAYEQLAEVSARLSWRPTFADLAGAGDMGYTTGPYELRPDGKGPEAYQYGHYVTVWRVQPDGSWKAVLDVGIRHPKPAKDESDIVVGEGWTPPPALARADPALVRSSLLLADRQIGEAAAKAGTAGALAAVFADDIRLYRPEHEPMIGRAAAGNKAALPDGSTWAPDNGAVAASADFGYTYGILEAGAEEFVYFRIWKFRERRWTLVLDLLSPIPGKT